MDKIIKVMISHHDLVEGVLRMRQSPKHSSSQCLPLMSKGSLYEALQIDRSAYELAFSMTAEYPKGNRQGSIPRS
ncbi:hypothetical protein [Paenibacillus sp. DS2015]|uniref:hypothetical protein n=1 Tax=Paenibacillus sp. DS2015 TaxID=3373917 RepID=UPI003D1B7BB1